MRPPEIFDSLGTRFPEQIVGRADFRGETTFVIQPAALREIARFCRDELGFDYLLDISSVDNFGSDPRFEIVYELYSLGSGIHLRFKVSVAEDAGAVDTISDIWPTANWHEREVWDMMGLRFHGHPDLRRILMWEGYPYFPLRKEFPLEGQPSEMPDVAFTAAAPMAGGPFVTLPSTATAKDREPRAHPPRD